MDHDEALGIIEAAAAEPHGLERLMAGDTPDAARLAGHLAECERCGAELQRIGRAAAIVRQVVRDQPSPELRERTLAYVRGVGRPRDGAAAATDAEPPSRRRAVGGWRSGLGWVASMAGAAVLAAGITAVVITADRSGDQRYEDTIAALAKVTSSTLIVDGQPDARRVALRTSDGTAAAATLVFSPSTTQFVVVATDLAQPPAGSEYRCWLEVRGTRTRVGRMFFAGGLAYWVGPVPAVGSIDADATFGISLVPVASDRVDTAPVVSGTL